jgi:hypothetical protein
MTFSVLVVAIGKVALSWLITSLHYSKDDALHRYLVVQLASIGVGVALGGCVVLLFFRAVRSYYAVDSDAGIVVSNWLLNGGMTLRAVMLIAIVKPAALTILLSGATDALDIPLPESFPGWRYVPGRCFGVYHCERLDCFQCS